MKKWFSFAVIAFAAIVLPYSSCTKDDGGGGGGSDSAVFTKKVVIEDLTGAWCGFCTRVYNKLDAIKASKPNVIIIGVHGGSGGDPFKFSNYPAYMSKFSLGGYPSGVLNREAEWDEETSSVDAKLAEPALLGLSIASTVNTDNISGTVKVKFGTNMTNKPMKLVVALVENGLVYPQTNYYSPQYGYTPYLYGGVSPISDFTHNGVLRRTATDLWGDNIPADAQVKNGEYAFNFSMPLTGQTYTGSTYTVNTSKCGIVAMVVDDTEAVNAQYAVAGTTKNYD